MDKILKYFDNNLIKLNEYSTKEITKLYKEYGHKKLASKLHIIKEQIKLNIFDHYWRIKSLFENFKPRDSSSKEIYIVKFGEEEGIKRFIEKNNKSKHNLESFIKKYGEEIGPIEYKKYCISKTHSLQSYQIRYGEDGERKFREYWENTNFSTSEKTFKRKYGDNWELERDKFKEKLSYANSLERYENLYGTLEGRLLYYDKIKRISNSNLKERLIERMLSEGASFAEIQEKIEDRWSRSLITCIRKYGEEEGNKRYNSWKENILKVNPLLIDFHLKDSDSYEEAEEKRLKIIEERNNSIDFSSKESLKEILPIIKEIEEKYNEYCYYGKNEYFLTLTKEERKIIPNRKQYFYDFTFKERKIIIEYNGHYYHDNNLNYESTKNMKNAPESRDLLKKWFAEQKGFDVFVIRSDKLLEDKIKLIDFLKERGIEICQTKFL